MRVDDDLDEMSRDELIAEAKKLRAGIRTWRPTLRRQIARHIATTELHLSGAALRDDPAL
jgi:hypothetical protein